MATMKVMEVPGPGQELRQVERPVPEPGPGQVRIRVEACGVCHGDAVVKEGHMPGISYPRVPGHEVAGTVDDVGDGVVTFRAGDRVGVGWHGGNCGVCDACRRGEFIGCPYKLTCGISFDGGYAEYMIAPVSGVARIPAELSALDAAPLMCAGLTTFNALRHCGIRPGDLVAVQGIGGLGHLGIQFARRLGARVVAVSRGDDKRALALELGAHDYVDGANDDAAAALRGMGGARVILATAPNAKAVAALAGGLGLDGTLMIVAAPGDPVPVSALTLISTRGSVRGWASGTPADSEDTMKVAVLEGIRPTIETYPLSRAEEAYGRMMSSDVRFRAVLIPD